MEFMNKFEPKKKNTALDVLLKIFLVVGIVAGIAVTVKIVYDKYRKSLCGICDDDFCDDDCLFDDENCEYVPEAEGGDEEEKILKNESAAE